MPDTRQYPAAYYELSIAAIDAIHRSNPRANSAELQFVADSISAHAHQVARVFETEGAAAAHQETRDLGDLLARLTGGVKANG